MNKLLKGAVKSKTIWASTALAMLVPALEAFPEMKAFLGEYYGPALIALSMLIALLRVVTTQSLEDKADV